MRSRKPPPLTARERRAWVAGFNAAVDLLSEHEAHLRRMKVDTEDAIATVDQLRNAARLEYRRRDKSI